MNKLKELLARRIQTSGPLSLADYMADCLMHPDHGYYQKERVFGADGDFITAPEVSQMFGEMLGLWVADRWIAVGRPSTLLLVEPGPGRGTLMADLLRAARRAAGFTDAVAVHFIETSAQLRALQKKKVPHATWHDDFSSLPDGPAIIVANEFFDALPAHQFIKRDGAWFERCVGLQDEELGFVLAKPSAKLALVPDELMSAPEGAVVEVCPAALSITGAVAARLKAQGGTALFIDYGYSRSAPGDTFQALRAHEFTDPFAAPGSADLTTHVAFDRLASAAAEAGVHVHGPKEQGAFLMALGIGLRAQQLAASQDEAGQARVLSELKRLTAPDQMGVLFKVLALSDPKLPPPPGF